MLNRLSLYFSSEYEKELSQILGAGHSCTALIFCKKNSGMTAAVFFILLPLFMIIDIIKRKFPSEKNMRYDNEMHPSGGIYCGGLRLQILTSGIVNIPVCFKFIKYCFIFFKF
jgi:hypothetical protein